MRLFGVVVPAALADAVLACREHMRLAAGLSALVNILYLAPTIYMMQVYDRVVPTSGLTTLLWLTIVVVFMLAILAFMDGLRMRVLLRAGIRLDNRLAGIMLDKAMDIRSKPAALRDFDALRQAVAGAPLIAMFDIIWTPIYVLVAFLVHPAIGALAIIASLLLLAISMANHRANKAGGVIALTASAAAYDAQERITQRSELIRALGMKQAMITRLVAERRRALQFTTQQQFDGGRYATLAKFFRLVLQSVALGLGAWLAVENQISAGSIIAASVLVSRSLQPIELLIGNWGGVVQARLALDSLGSTLESGDTSKERFELPIPNGRLAVASVTVRSPDADARELLTDVSFTVDPGEFVGIIGPSGAGKSTLARLLSAAIRPDEGLIRIDGSDMRDWDPERLAMHIGYVPQDAGLLPGTIAENIARFALLRGDPADRVTQDTLVAARAAGVHNLIVNLPGGYDRRIGWGAEELSMGQRQRIALARALYGNPALLVLDEPNSALDAEGETALTNAIADARARGATVLMVTHRAPLLANASRLLLLVGGRISMVGPYQEVLAALQRPSAKPALADAGVH